MKKHLKRLLPLLLALMLMLSGCSQETVNQIDSVLNDAAPVVEAILDGLDESAPEPEQQPEAPPAEAPAAPEAPAETAEPEATLSPEAPSPEEVPAQPEATVSEDGEYTSKEEVAEYLYLYGHLPDNFITKNEAKSLGWESSKGNLGQVAPGKSIGGDYFGNYEGILPKAKGREYHECDIDSTGGYRGAKRIVFSNDGLIYYTEDHYEHFELLYGEE